MPGYVGPETRLDEFHKLNTLLLPPPPPSSASREPNSSRDAYPVKCYFSATRMTPRSHENLSRFSKMAGFVSRRFVNVSYNGLFLFFVIETEEQFL